MNKERFINFGYYWDATAELFDGLRWSLKRGDLEMIRVSLDGLAALLAHLRMALEIKYGRLRGPGLGAQAELPDWTDYSPHEILDDMRNAAAIQEHFIAQRKMELPEAVGEEKADLERRIAEMEDYLHRFIRHGRSIFLEKWPGWWSAERIKEFSDYLEPEK